MIRHQQIFVTSNIWNKRRNTRFISTYIYIYTFMSFVASMALRARLVALSPLVLVARLANRESTLVTRHECLPILLQTYLVSTYLTYFGLFPVFMSLNPTIMLSFPDKNIRLNYQNPLSIHPCMHASTYILKEEEEEERDVTSSEPCTTWRSWRPWEPV